MEATYVAGTIEGTVAIIGHNPSNPESRLELLPVKSSRLAQVGYAESAMLFFAVFPNGGVYEYAGVEPDVYEGLCEAESIGKFFNENIKGPKGSPTYAYRPVKAAGESGDPTRATAGQPTTVATAEPAKPSEPVSEKSSLVGEVLPPASRGTPAGPGGAERYTNTIPELPEKDEELKTRALVVQADAKATVIKDAGAYELADARLVTIKAERKLVLARLTPVYESAYKTYVEARTLRDEALAPYDEAERILKASMIQYRQWEARVRAEAEQKERRRLQEQADAEAAERSRLETEQQAKYAEAQGETKLAEEIRLNPVPIAPVEVAPVVLEMQAPVRIAKAGGGTRSASALKENWQWRATNIESLPATFLPETMHAMSNLGIQATEKQARDLLLRMGSFFAEFYTLDEKLIGARVKRLKKQHGIQGIEAYDAGSIATGKA